MFNSFTNSQWIIGVLIFLLIFFALLRFIFNKEMNNYLKATINNQVSNKIFLERNALLVRVSFFMNLIFILNFGTLIYFAQNIYCVDLMGCKGVVLLLLSMTLVFIIYLGKYILLKVLGYIFFIQQSLNEYIHNIFIYNKLFGISILPVLICLPFVEIEVQKVLMVICAILFIMFFIARIIRGVSVAWKNKLSIFYIFLYLCTLEILPAMILYKIYTL